MRKGSLRNLFSEEFAKWLPPIRGTPFEESLRRDKTADHIAVFCGRQPLTLNVLIWNLAS